MTRYLLTIHGPSSRHEAMAVVSKAPIGTRVELKAAKRTGPQNDRMWAMLTEISLQMPWDGKKRTPDKWKDLFMDALRAELDDDIETLPALDGSPRRVNVGNSTSDLSKEEMSMLIELMFKFGAEHKVVFSEDEQVAA